MAESRTNDCYKGTRVSDTRFLLFFFHFSLNYVVLDCSNYFPKKKSPIIQCIFIWLGSKNFFKNLLEETSWKMSFFPRTLYYFILMGNIFVSFSCVNILILVYIFSSTNLFDHANLKEKLKFKCMFLMKIYFYFMDEYNTYAAKSMK